MAGMRQLLYSVFVVLQLFPCTISVTVTTSKSKVEIYENMNAVLSCEFRTERDTDPRIEWKGREGKDVSYVYFDGEFTAPVQAPSCYVPDSVLSGSAVELRCEDKLAAPSALYSWFKDNKLLNSGTTYSLDPKTGTLKFKSVSQADGGQYRCETSSGTGAPKSCAAQHMKIVEYELTLTLVVAVGLGAALSLLLASLAVCLCCRRDRCSCCRAEKKKGKQKRNVNNHRLPADPRHYKHTQSFMI